MFAIGTMPMNKTITIIGGGIVGLNIAYHLGLQKKYEIFLLEREEFLGHHTSTRNSEVIHAGFAYGPNSLKAKLCVEGNRLTFELLNKLQVVYKREGKWIIARDERESQALEALMANAKECSVPGMKFVKPDDVVSKTPEIVVPKSVVHSETSGIIDCAGYIRALEVVLSNMERVEIVYPCAVQGVDTKKGIVSTNRGEINFDVLINSAGLFADEVYKMSGGDRNFEIRPYKGEYYTWRKGKIDGLVYPVSHRFLNVGDATKVSSMGVHLHRNVAGELFIGPTEIPLLVNQKTDYSISTTASQIIEQVSWLLKTPPSPTDIEQGFAGNRPKLFEDGKPIGDFKIFKDENVVHLLGIESPGLTSAPAIARHVGNLI